MAKEYYLSYNDAERAAFLEGLARELPALAARLRISLAELDSVRADARAYAWTLSRLNATRNHAQAWTAYKNSLSTGSGAASAFPEPPPPGEPPPPVPPGIFKRVRNLMARIKNSPGYDESIGRRLGIIGPERVLDPSTLRPQLKVRLVNGGQPEICWKKQRLGAIRLEVDRGQGWTYLTVDARPNTPDPFPLPPTPALWKYRALYLKNDQPIGQWSDVVTVNVGGI